MIRPTLFPLLLLAACDAPQPAIESATARAEYVESGLGTEDPNDVLEPEGGRRPDLGIDEVDARDAIEALGSAWRPELDQPSRTDGYSGGFSKNLAADDRVSTIYTLANGRVWNVKLQAGLGKRCGSSDELARAFPMLLEAVVPGVDGESIARLKRGLSSESGQEVRIGTVKLQTTGGCLKRFDIRTIPYDARGN